ncbi:MAG: hypothetical protein AAGF95_07830 [Chloroflexota bacterium]
MNDTSKAISRTFRVTIDINTCVRTTPSTEGPRTQEANHHYQILVQRLCDEPAHLDYLLRASAIQAIGKAEQTLGNAHGWRHISEQQLFEAVMEGLEPATQAYFQEELEDGESVYYFDGYDTTIQHIDLEIIE